MSADTTVDPIAALDPIAPAARRGGGPRGVAPRPSPSPSHSPARSVASAAPPVARPEHGLPQNPAPQHPAPQHPAPQHPAPQHPAPQHPAPRRERLARRRSRLGAITFVLLFLVPTGCVAAYYAFLASDQYVVEVQFAVRGVEVSPLGALGSLGFGALPGTTTESSDSYVVADYIGSVQIVDDIARHEGVDMRGFFARPSIDAVHRIDPAMPLARFVDTWRRRTNVEYNSITGNTTFEVYAFTPKDARRIADLVLRQSQRVVNGLSREARAALVSSARAEVERTQRRLREVSAAVLAFRNVQGLIDPNSDVTVEAAILGELEGELATRRTARRALRANVSANSPAVRVIDREIEALEAQIREQRRNIGTGEGGRVDDTNLASVVGEFADLTLQEEFARAAYTTALAALETAQADARKQQRYLATFVAPSAPDVSVHPKRLLYTLVAAFWFLVLWALVVFVTRSVRDHAI